MPRSLLSLQWLRLLQQAHHLNLQAAAAGGAHPHRARQQTLKQPWPGGLSLVEGGRASYPSAKAERFTCEVAIVGAGLAGLNAAYQLQKLGIIADVFEASDRVGGRILSVLGAVSEGIVSDLGGELVNSNHSDLKALAEEFDIPLLARSGSGQELQSVSYIWDGRRHSEAEVAEAMRGFAAQVMADAQLLDEDWQQWGPHFDNQSLEAYLNHHRATLNRHMRALIEALVRVEFGVEPVDCSALQLLYLLPVVDGDQVELLSTGDEAWVVEGGSERIVRALYKAVRSHVQTGMALSRIESLGEGYALTFNGKHRVQARYLVLALPFSALRQVDLRVPLPESLSRCIAEINLGQNEKLIAGVNQRVWRAKQGFAVECWNDQSASLVWDSSLRELQSENHGALTFLLGGKEVEMFTEGSAEQHGQGLVQEYNALIPGLEDASNGRFLCTAWHKATGICGGYTNLKPGQYTGFASRWMYVESPNPEVAQYVHVGRMVFAGEHTSDEFYGFMNGAAQSGRLAAQWIWQDSKLKEECGAGAGSQAQDI